MPEKVFKKLNERILPQWKACFFTALIVGLLAHLYKITNWLPNWDSLVFRYDSQNMIGLGRWFLPVVCSFSSFYDLPFLNGIIAILFHALSAVYICRILNIEKNITAGFIGAVIVSFPTVTSVMMYNYVADGYSIAFFLSTLAAYFMTKGKPRFYILSSVLIALSTGIYQAYITVTIMLVLLKLIDEVIYDKEEELADVFKKSMFMLFSGVMGVMWYGIVLKLVLWLSSSQLLDYQGINSAAFMSNIDLISSLYSIKETFIKCFFDFSQGVNVYVIINVFVVVFTGYHYIKYIIKNEIYKKAINILVIVILTVMLIVGAGALAFVNASIDYHNLMLMGYAVFYLFFIVLYERGGDDSEKHASVKCWIIVITVFTLISNQIVISNVSYHKAQMAYEKSYGVLIRIADRIEQTDGAEECDRIMVIGALPNSEDYSINLTPDITGITDGYIIRADDETVGQSVLCSALNDYCEKNYGFVSGAEKKALSDTAEVKSMGVWPSEDCITVLDNTVIIKLEAEGEQ